MTSRSNFGFLIPHWEAFADTAMEAERQAATAPSYSAILCRISLEEWLRWMYEHDPDLEIPYDTSISSLMHAQCFKNLLDSKQLYALNLIRKTGNTAAHTNTKIDKGLAIHCLSILHSFTGWVVSSYGTQQAQIEPFDISLLPDGTIHDRSRNELKQIEANYHEAQKELSRLKEELEKTKSLKESNKDNIIPLADPDEALTRSRYIDILLDESGWDLSLVNVKEYQLTGMPTGSGDGRADYVLWGDDGRPLAVVEAKRTRRDAREGQTQAKLYADCLEAMYGQRPVIFYTNGFDTWMWDDTAYPPRVVYGFYSRDELQTLINRRSHTPNLLTEPINTDIVERYYQQEAIRAVCEKVEKKSRTALLVMATGTGKTRTAAALIDLLSKAGRVKRVLFLADRLTLVHQAKTYLNTYLPNMPSVDLTREKEDESSRIVFSTYQTLINMIDGEFHDDDRYYSIGHFDLIIFDEIHRSVYNKYKYIFKYFDAIKVGLTATPKAETDRNTYDLFELEPNNPTYAYELEQAVSDGFLTPPVAVSVPLKFQREGIRYADLNPEERARYEEEFSNPGETGLFMDEIEAGALNKWLFNADTVDKVIAHLMENGIKVSGGDKLGKTIIFARNHRHAVFIAERFDRQFPEYKGHFLKTIDYKEEYKYDLLNHFREKHELPQIAVSVDMLDTGVDIPEVVNLVFFKPVRSATKFWQMIGRGTRLCRDLFGPGMDKKEFMIFDFCENFEFFQANPKGVKASKSKSLSQRLFDVRLLLSQNLLREVDTELREYAGALRSILIQQTQGLNQDSFIVRQHLRIVERYNDPASWDNLSELDIQEIMNNISPLVNEVEQDEFAKRFDLLMLDMQLLASLHQNRDGLVNKVISIAVALSKKTTIPAIAEKMETLKAIQTEEYWKEAGIQAYEYIRTELRDIIKFLEGDSLIPIIYTDFEDTISDGVEMPIIYSTNDLSAYKRKVEKYIRDHQNNLIIQKLRNNIPITKHELKDLERMLFEQGEAGTRDNFVQAYGEQPLGIFIRSIIGLDTNAAKVAFGQFLSNTSLNSRQIRFIDTIINYLSAQGNINPEILYEPPFSDIDSSGLSGVFNEEHSGIIINLIQEINHNALGA